MPNPTLEKALKTPAVSMTVLQAIPFPGVVVIMGRRGMGKTALGHYIMGEFHKRRGFKGAILGLPSQKKKLVPRWVKPVASVLALPDNSVCLVDEAAQWAHARRSQSAQAVELDNLVSMSRQRRQLILFIAHHSRKLDINLIHDSDRLLWKMPTEAHVLFERAELQPFTRKALDAFRGLRKPRQGETAWLRRCMTMTYVMDLHNLRFGWLKNGLPSWWRDELSNGYSVRRGMSR